MKALLLGPAQQDNLALGYLASYARTRGHDVVVAAYRDSAEAEATAEAEVPVRRQRGHGAPPLPASEPSR